MVPIGFGNKSLFGTCESNLFPKWSGNHHLPLRGGNKHPHWNKHDTPVHTHGSPFPHSLLLSMALKRISVSGFWLLDYIEMMQLRVIFLSSIFNSKCKTFLGEISRKKSAALINKCFWMIWSIFLSIIQNVI